METYTSQNDFITREEFNETINNLTRTIAQLQNSGNTILYSNRPSFPLTIYPSKTQAEAKIEEIFNGNLVLIQNESEENQEEDGKNWSGVIFQKTVSQDDDNKPILKEYLNLQPIKGTQITVQKFNS